MSNIDMNKNFENGSSNYTGDDKFVIKNLNLHYGDFHALKNINMNIPKNQITAFIGPSGCGKSTFLKTLNRMNDLIEGVKIDGEVYLDGANIFTEMDDITLRHRVGMVFQQPNPFPKSIYDNIAVSYTHLAVSNNIACFVSLEEKMACGIGACLACVCQSTDIDDHSKVKNKRVCKEGPVFNVKEVEL